MAGILQNTFGNPAYVNQTNLNGKLRKKLGEPNGGPSKNLGGMAHPGPPLESPLDIPKYYEQWSQPCRLWALALSPD